MPSKEPRHANLLRLATIGIGLSCLAKGITSRRKRSELEELSVSCDLPGARPDRLRNLKVADFNLSSARAQSERAKLPSGRAKAYDLDWPGLVEEFCRRILRADRNGQPAVDVREFTRPTADDDIEVGGFYLPRRLSTCDYHVNQCNRCWRCTGEGEYFFWTGRSNLATAVENARRSIQRVRNYRRQRASGPVRGHVLSSAA